MRHLGLPARRSALLLALPVALGAGCGASGTGFAPWDGGLDQDLPIGDLAGSAGADLASSVRLTSAVSVVIEPDATVAPITAAISGAKSSISIEVYLLTHAGITNSLIAARKAGRAVKVILEMTPTGSSNAAVYSQLMAAGVSVKWGSNAFNFTHAKSMIVDGATLYAMTLNLSVSAFTDNREYALIDTDPADVAEAQAVFDADWNNAATPPVANLVIAPTNARGKLDKIIGGATSRLDIEWESLSDSQVALKIQDRIRAGVKTSILAPSNVLGTPSQNILNALKGAGATVRLLDKPYIHAKMILVDRDRGFVGSENATANSLDNNRELGVLWQSPDVAAKIGAAFDSDWARGAAF